MSALLSSLRERLQHFTTPEARTVLALCYQFLLRDEDAYHRFVDLRSFAEDVIDEEAWEVVEDALEPIPLDVVSFVAFPLGGSDCFVLEALSADLLVAVLRAQSPGDPSVEDAADALAAPAALARSLLAELPDPAHLRVFLTLCADAPELDPRSCARTARDLLVEV